MWGYIEANQGLKLTHELGYTHIHTHTHKNILIQTDSIEWMWLSSATPFRMIQFTEMNKTFKSDHLGDHDLSLSSDTKTSMLHLVALLGPNWSLWWIMCHKTLKTQSVFHPFLPNLIVLSSYRR